MLSRILLLRTNTMNTDQTAPKIAVGSGSISFAITTIKVHMQIREQATVVMNGKKTVKLFILFCLDMQQ